MQHLFIYYRVSDEPAASAALSGALHRLMQGATGLRAEGFVRRDAAAPTVMESYAFDDPSWTEATAQAAIARLVEPTMRRWLVGERHVERFHALPVMDDGSDAGVEGAGLRPPP